MGYINPETEELESLIVDTKPIANSGGGVTHSTAHLVIEHLATYRKIPNMQWHTHPGIGVGWSSTDLNAQDVEMQTLLAGSESGVFYWMVVDQLDWKITKVAWEDRKPTLLHDGFVTLHDVALCFRSRYQIAYSSYGSNNYNYYDGIVAWKNKNGDKEEGDSEDDSEGFDIADAPDSAFDALFETYDVEKYEWGTLRKAIESENPNERNWYYYVLSRPSTWPYLGKKGEELLTLMEEGNHGL